jgi:hypothetical protein
MESDIRRKDVNLRPADGIANKQGWSGLIDYTQSYDQIVWEFFSAIERGGTVEPIAEWTYPTHKRHSVSILDEDHGFRLVSPRCREDQTAPV